MIKVDQTEKSQLFYMPWDYTIKPFISDSEKRAELIEKEVSTEIDIKLDSLKNEMNVKNQAIMELIHSKFAQVSQLISAGPAPRQDQPSLQPPSYAGVAAARAPGHVGQPGGQVRGGLSGSGGVSAHISPPVPTFNIIPAETVHNPDQGGSHGFGDIRSRGRANHGEDLLSRSRSNSNKRRRLEDGTSDESSAMTRDRSQSQNNNRQKKFVVGTSNQAGKMISLYMGSTLIPLLTT